MMHQVDSNRAAVFAEVLFLANLLIAPGIAFVGIGLLLYTERRDRESLAYQHASQAFGVSLFGGAIIVIVSGLLFISGGFSSAYTWTAVILYFTCVHSALILFGVVALVKALNSERYRFPLVGRFFAQ